MASSKVIDEKYRMTPADLAEGERMLVITNVTFQGLENVHPVLHFDAHSKWLVCNPGQCNDLARITNSAVCSDWIGATVLVQAIDDEDGPAIALSRAQIALEATPQSNTASSLPPWFGSFIITLLVGLLFLLVFLLEQNDALWESLLGLFQ